MNVLGYLLIILFRAFVSTAPPTCQTTCGPVAGMYQDGAYSFRGIPYAEPPFGKLRWKPPRALSKQAGTCWNGTLTAQKYGNTCYQRSPYDPTKYDGNEDCLYLNVFTPTLSPVARKPVMIWLHGGSLIFSNGNWPLYSPTEKLSKDTDIVYVGLNYRLHAFGFLALQLLADDSETKTSGNYGFMDMILASEWVKSNIASFGGDPNQVTFIKQLFQLLFVRQVAIIKRSLKSGTPMFFRQEGDNYMYYFCNFSLAFKFFLFKRRVYS